jgi:flagellar hook-associated protein 3 FlgL
MLFDGAGARSARARSELDRAASEAATGLRVQHPWDDPPAAGLIVTHRAEVRRFESIERNAKLAYDEAHAIDGALGTVTDTLNRAKELALQGASDPNGPVERKAMALEIGTLFQQARAQLNLRFGDRYLFSGNLDDRAPFDESGAYLGDSGQRQVELAPGVYERVGVRADVAIDGGGGGVRVLETFQDLQAALEADDTQAIRAAVSDLDRGIHQVIEARAQNGSSMTSFDTAAGAARLARDTGMESIVNLSEVDIVEAASRFAFAQRALDTALSASAKSFELTLLGKLR